jgi:hypothetical protein
MVKCPVCNKFNISKSNIDFEMFHEGVLKQVCGACYHEAFLKTNLSRMLHAPHKAFMKEEV